MPRRIDFALIVVANILSLSIVLTADASISLITSRAALAGTDNLDWGDLGADLQTFFPPIVTMLSDDGLSVTISQHQGSLERRDQGPNWGGNFAPGDELLRTATVGATANGPMKIDFGTNTIEAFGLQIEGNFLGPYTAQIEAFDSVGGSLGTVTSSSPGFFSATEAMFIGLSSDVSSTDFHSVIVSIISGGTPDLRNDFAVNQADFTPATNDVAAVPLPAAFVIWSLLGLTAASCNLRRREVEGRIASIGS